MPWILLALPALVLFGALVAWWRRAPPAPPSAPVELGLAPPVADAPPIPMGELTINGQRVTLEVVSDDHPVAAGAARLWGAVYLDELRYRPAAGRPFRAQPAGSLLLVARAGGDCVGTLRMSYPGGAPTVFEHPYASLLPGRRTGVLSGFVLREDYRRTPLALHLLSACHRFNALSGNDRRYDTILMSCVPATLHYYYLFGFELLLPDIVAHTELDLDAFVVVCSRERNEQAVRDIDRLLAGDRLTQLRWALRAPWIRRRARRHVREATRREASSRAGRGSVVSHFPTSG